MLIRTCTETGSRLLSLFTLLIVVSVAGGLPRPAAAQPLASLNVEQLPYAHPGDTVEVSLLLEDIAPGFMSGGFTFFFQYDTTILSIVSAEAGQSLLDCGWEVFAWRRGIETDCGGSPCPGGTVHITAIADNIVPEGEPLCWALSEGEIVRLTFAVTNDEAVLCETASINWYWYGCTDNEWASKNGDSLYMSAEVYDASAQPVTAEADFPHTFGAGAACFPSPTILRKIDYYHGAVDIVCSDSLDGRGDVNLNGLAYEISDWTMFKDYFLQGYAVFDLDPVLQAANTDANANGEILTLDDLLYLWRVVIGDALPFPRPGLLPDTLIITQNAPAKTVSFSYPDSIRALHLKFDDSTDVTFSRVFGQMGQSVLSDSTRVVIHTGDNLEPFGSGGILSFTDDARLVYAEASSDGLTPIPVRIEVVGIPVKVELAPQPLYAWQANAVNPASGTVYIGNLSECSVRDIAEGSVRLNGDMEPIEWELVAERPGFLGEVLAVTFDMRELIRPLVPIWDTVVTEYAVNWSAAAGCAQTVTGEATIVGHRLGDINGDGAVNLGDVLLLVGYLFRQGEPGISTAGADVDGSGTANVGDVVRLVQLLYR